MNEKMKIGEIVKAQGIKGELKVRPVTDDPMRFTQLKAAYIDGVLFKINAVRLLSAGLFVTLEGITDRNTAERMRGKWLEIERTEAVTLPEDRHFIVDLLGMRITDGQSDYGILKEILQHGAADVYVVATENGTMMFPAIKRVILQTDLDARTILVDADKLSEVAVYED